MKLVDTLHLIRCLSFRKLRNAFRLAYSFYISNKGEENLHKGNPMSMSIEPTTSCNLKCPECPSGLRQFTRPTGNLKTTFFEEIINQSYKDLIFLIFYFQGEPYINKSFLDMVKIASQKGIYTITSTNGHFLTPSTAEKTIKSGLSRIIISLDGITQDVYEDYRVGGKLNVVIQGAKNLVAAKKKLKSSTPHIVFQTLVTSKNESQMDDIRALSKQIGVDELKFKTIQVYDFKNGNPLLPKNENYSRYKKNEKGLYELKRKSKEFCWKQWHSTVVTWDGKILPCCFDKDAQNIFGSIKDEPLSKIWEGEENRKFQHQLLTNKKNIPICSNCSEGTPVWLGG